MFALTQIDTIQVVFIDELCFVGFSFADGVTASEGPTILQYVDDWDLERNTELQVIEHA